MSLLNMPLYLYYDVDGRDKIPVGLDNVKGIGGLKGTYHEALHGPHCSEHDGIGMVITRDIPIVFIDLDNYDARFLSQENILRLLSPTSYVHRSTRGGYHILTAVRDKSIYTTKKRSGVEIYVSDRFAALVNPMESEAIPLDNLLDTDSSDVFHRIYKALGYIYDHASDGVIDLLRRGTVYRFPSSSEYDHAMVSEMIRDTVEQDVIHGVLLLSESDNRRLADGKQAKLTSDTYVERTINSVKIQWSKYVVTEAFDPAQFASLNLIEVGGKPFARRKSISVIKALLNSGKGHFALSLCCAGYAGADALGAKADRPYKVMYVDTEMGRELTAMMGNMIERRLGRSYTSKEFILASVKQAHTVDRLSVISSLVQLHSPDIVVIDGVRDLVLNFNDVTESHILLEQLEHLADTHNCAVIVTIHTNIGQESQKARGHIGSEIEQKAFAVIQLTRSKEDRDEILVTQSKSRISGFFEGFSMRWSQAKGYFTHTGEHYDNAW